MAALVALLIPASAFAGTYSWALPGDFSGHNPETKYGVPSWSYDGTTGAPMTSFSNNTWSDGIGDSIGANNSGFMTMGAAGGNSAQIAWSNPFTASQAVSVTNTMSASCPVSLGGGLNPNPSGTMTVTPGQTLAFKLNGGLLGCTASGTISISASVPAPSVSVTSPTSGATVGSFQQTFAGTASSGFGISNQVTVRLYSGASASGTPVETLTTTQSGGAWSVPASAILVNGQYTVQAEQDDLAGDQGLSSPVTFTVNHLPAVSITSPTSGATVTAFQQSFAGTASDGFGISNQVTLRVYSGSSASGTPVETLSTTESGGAWSMSSSSVLANGTYTAQAEQDDTVGDQGFSSPVTFTVSHSPAVSVTSPTSGATVTAFQQSFAGTASSGFGISDTVTVRVYSGAAASGTPVETLTTTQSGGSWSVSASSVLANGTYTVQAEQDDLAGDQGLSSPVTFTVSHPPPAVSVTSPKPGTTVTNAQPSFAGAAGSGFGISDTVTVRLYSGASASGTPVETLTTTQSGGAWSVSASSMLDNGTYTVQAEQDDTAGDQGFSTPVTFTEDHMPVVSVTSPSFGATITDPQPAFSGGASSGLGISDTVTVRLYSGPSASGTPIETLTTTQQNDSWAVFASSILANGQYTVQAEQDDTIGDQGFSAPITFTVAVPPPTVSLNSLGSAPLQVVAPTLTGTGSTRSVDDGQVTVDVYSGTDTSVPAIRTLSASLGSGGSFSVKVQPDLSDGQYTAVATQGSSVGPGSSRAIVFRVKVTPPAVTLDQPGSGVTLNVTKPTFSGRAGTALGDSPNVTVYVYKGSSASGNPVGSDEVSANGSNWSTKWPHKLSYGSYTVVAAQSDDAGHTSRTTPTTFTVAPTPKLIGSTATVSRSGGASVQIGCVAGPGQTCTGTVLIVTRRAYRATAGGPAGALEVLYASVRVPGGQALVIHRPVSASVLRVLRRSRRVPVVVTVNLSRPSGGRLKGRANLVLKIQR